MKETGTKINEIQSDIPGIILLSHGPLASGLLGTMEMVLGTVENVTALELEEGDHTEEYRKRIAEIAEAMPEKSVFPYSHYFTCLNMGVIYLDLAFLLGFIPGLILACMGCFCLVGALTIFTVAVGALLSATVYLYQKKLGIPFHNSLPGFIAFLLVFQGLQSTAALHGYMIHLFHRKGEWK